MRRDLAERLLAKIMNWTDEEKARERAFLESFAAYKYDEYQQYAPGLRFLESLARWLRQFQNFNERRIAYDFIKNQLIFVSEAEITHLVELAYPTFVRPWLLEKTANEIGILHNRVKKLVTTTQYRLNLRKTLVLGLSDGARTDSFRRANPQVISNEQIWHAYDVSDAKAKDIQENLSSDLAKILGEEPDPSTAKFGTVVLLDDFTASGTSYLRKEDGVWKGKIAKIVRKLDSNEELGALIPEANVQVIVVIYVAAPQAIEHIERELPKLPFGKGQIEFQIVHRLNPSTKLTGVDHPELFELLKNPKYFDNSADDEHGAKGGGTVRFGYADCRLPVVLSHNTPNNSLFILWAEDILNVHGLFPRVSRHRTFE